MGIVSAAVTFGVTNRNQYTALNSCLYNPESLMTDSSDDENCAMSTISFYRLLTCEFVSNDIDLDFVLSQYFLLFKQDCLTWMD